MYGSLLYPSTGPDKISYAGSGIKTKHVPSVACFREPGRHPLFIARPFGIAAQAVDLFNHPVWGVQLPGRRNAVSFGEESCRAFVFVRHGLCRVGWRDCGHGWQSV